MKWLFVRAVCLKIDECSAVSITAVSQHKCRSVTLKGLSNQTWFNLSFFSPALRAQRARALHYSSSSAKWMHFLYNFFFSLSLLREGGGMVVYQWPSTCEEIISSCSLHALTIWEFSWSRGRSGRREGAFGAIFFSIDKGPSPTQLCRNSVSGACPAFYSSIKYSSSGFS